MIASYLLCCAIIATTMGGLFSFDISISGEKTAVVNGLVRYFGEPAAHSAAADTSAVSDFGAAFDTELGTSKTLTLSPGCTLSGAGYVFTFIGGAGHAGGRWKYAYLSADEHLQYSAVNRILTGIAETYGIIEYIVHCTATAGKPRPSTLLERRRVKFSDFSAHISKITITGTIAVERDVCTVHGRERRAGSVPEPEPSDLPPPGTFRIVQTLSLARLPAEDQWMRSYWAMFAIISKKLFCEESYDFLNEMRIFVRGWRGGKRVFYGGLKLSTKEAMVKIFNKYINRDTDTEIIKLNLNPVMVIQPLKRALRRTGFEPTDIEWRDVIEKTAELIDSWKENIRQSAEYIKWLMSTDDGIAYRKMAESDAASAGETASATPHHGLWEGVPGKKKKFTIGSETIGSETKPDTAVQLDNNLYRRGVYDRYDVAAAYLRGYKNGLLERLNK